MNADGVQSASPGGRGLKFGIVPGTEAFHVAMARGAEPAGRTQAQVVPVWIELSPGVIRIAR